MDRLNPITAIARNTSNTFTGIMQIDRLMIDSPSSEQLSQLIEDIDNHVHAEFKTTGSTDIPLWIFMAYQRVTTAFIKSLRVKVQ